MVEAAAVSTTLATNVSGNEAQAGGRQPGGAGEARFLQAMEGTEPGGQAAHCREGGDAQCIGDKVLDNLQKIKSNYDETVNKINTSVTGIEITPQGLLKLQMEIAKLQLQEELMAKTASKSTQNVDTLLKSQ